MKNKIILSSWKERMLKCISKVKCMWSITLNSNKISLRCRRIWESIRNNIWHYWKNMIYLSKKSRSRGIAKNYWDWVKTHQCPRNQHLKNALTWVHSFNNLMTMGISLANRSVMKKILDRYLILKTVNHKKRFVLMKKIINNAYIITMKIINNI